VSEAAISPPEVKSEAAPITAIVTMLPVSDMERSVKFYRLLGLEIGNRQPHEGTPHWVWLYAPKAQDWKRGANLMLVLAGGAVIPNGQMLFYLYATDLVALRNQLLARGVKAGEIEYPEYLPKGECKVLDPDGYVLMLAQSYEQSP